MDFPWVRRTTKSLRIDPNTGLAILPPGRIEWRHSTYTFPGIIYTWKARFSDDQVRANLSFFENRYPVSMTVAAKHVITYHHTQPDLSALNFFKVITRPWAQIFFSIPDNTIHPPAPITLAQQSVERGGIAFDIQGGQSSEPAFYTPGDELLVGRRVAGEVRTCRKQARTQTLRHCVGVRRQFEKQAVFEQGCELRAEHHALGQQRAALLDQVAEIGLQRRRHDDQRFAEQGAILGASDVERIGERGNRR